MPYREASKKKITYFSQITWLSSHHRTQNTSLVLLDHIGWCGVGSRNVVLGSTKPSVVNVRKHFLSSPRLAVYMESLANCLFVSADSKSTLYLGAKGEKLKIS